MAADEHAADPIEGRAFTGTVGRLTVLNVSVTLLGIGTGILQARGLGPDGRGELAAIIIPLYFVAFLGDIGLGLYARREAARDCPVGEVIGTTGVLVLGLGVVAGVALLPVVGVIARDRSVVQLWLSIGLLFLPLNLVATLLMNVAFGLERWELWIRSRLIVAVGWLVAVATIYLSGHLTVMTAAASYFGLTVASYLPLFPLVLHARPLRFRWSRAREAIPFASRAWLANLTNLVNIRLDMLFMAGVVSSHQLGLYAVAVTLAAFPSNFSGAVGLGLLPRVVRQGEELVGRTVRVALTIVVALGAVVAVAAWPVIHLLVGSEYGDALPMIWVLLLAEIPLAGTVTLGQAVIGAGSPGRAAVAEGLAVLVTILGLMLVLAPMGGVGAALVSLVAYTVSFSYLLWWSRKLVGSPARSFLWPTKADVAWGARKIRRLLVAAAHGARSRAGCRDR